MFKNKTFRNVFTIVVFSLVFISLLIDANFFLIRVRDKNQTKIWLEKYDVIVDDVDSLSKTKNSGSYVKEQFIAKDKDGKVIATLYGGTASNAYGTIELIVAVDSKGTIIGIEAFVFEQTLNQDKALAYIDNFKGLKVSSIKNNANTTGATVSKNSIDLIIEEIVSIHLGEAK